MTRALLLVLLVACSVRDVSFIGPGVGDGGNGDGNGDGMTDGSTPSVLLNGYIIDEMANVKHVKKDAATGMLTAQQSYAVSSGGPYLVAAASQSGSHLYVFSGGGNNGRSATLMIGPTGGLTELTTGLVTNCPFQRNAVLHPNGTFIAVGCDAGNVAVIPVQSNGSLGSSALTTVGVGRLSVAFSADGNCLYVADEGAPATEAVKAATFNSNTGAVTGIAASVGPPPAIDLAVSPNGRYLYVLGPSAAAPIVQPYDLISPCGIQRQAANVPVASDSQALAMHPGGQYLSVLGNSTYSFLISSAGMLSMAIGSPSNPTTAPAKKGVFDPAFPSKLYIIEEDLGVMAAPVTNGIATSGPVMPSAGIRTKAFVLAR